MFRVGARARALSLGIKKDVVQTPWCLNLAPAIFFLLYRRKV